MTTSYLTSRDVDKITFTFTYSDTIVDISYNKEDDDFNIKETTLRTEEEQTINVEREWLEFVLEMINGH